MNDHQRLQREKTQGILSAVLAYVIWGVLPMYWKLLSDLPPNYVLAHRILWSLVFMVIVLAISGTMKTFLQSVRSFAQFPKTSIPLFLASLLITLNWLVFIWAVNNNQVVETSIGYYINPLISVFLGMLFLKEKMNKLQWISLTLATVGVLNLILQLGKFPWVSITLALCFALYGFCKKFVKVGALVGLTIETLIVAPFAFLYLILFSKETGEFLASGSIETLLLLIGSGAATAIPLLLFASAVSRITLTLIGFLQYLAPTMMLLLGVFLYKEPFTSAHILSFVLIWSALVLYTFSSSKVTRKKVETREVV